jgi:hypothetical protein
MTEELRQQLTAYVDGALSASERAAVDQLLQQSPEGRALLQQLQADASLLRSLTRKSILVDLSQSPKFTVRAGQGTRAEVLRRRWRTLRRLQAAAVFFIVVGAGLGWLLLRGMVHKPEKVAPPPRELLASLSAEPAKPSLRTPTSPTEKKLPTPAIALTTAEATAAWKELRAAWEQLTRAANSRLQAAGQLALRNWAEKSESVPGERILTSPVLGQGNPFKSLEFKLPPLRDLADLPPNDTAKLLKPSAIHYLDLSGHDGPSSLAALQASFRKTGLPLVTDQELTTRLNRRLPATVMIYVENVTVEQTQKLLQTLAKENTAGGEAAIKSVLFQTLDEKGLKWLASTLGVAPFTLLPHDPEQRKMLGIDSTKPISEETLKMLLKLSAGQGRGKPAPVVGVALAYGTPRLVAPSKELLTALEQRQGLQPGKVSLVLFVRTAK